MKENSALIIMDFINDIAHQDGKFNFKGYANFIHQKNIVSNINKAITAARKYQSKIVFVRLAFQCVEKEQGSDKDQAALNNQSVYKDKPENSILLSKADQFNALVDHSWGTDILTDLHKEKEDYMITKTRISPFYGTALESYLRTHHMEHVYFSGVATDLVVQSAARDAHDRDFEVYVLADCCADSDESTHNAALKSLAKFSNILSIADLQLIGL